MSNINTGNFSDPNVTPPIPQATALGLQHVLAMFASNITPAIIVSLAAGVAFGSEAQIYLIQMAMLFAGVATLFQTVGFGPVGARLPIMQGTSFAFVGVLVATAKIIMDGGGTTKEAMAVVLTSCIVAGILHFILGSFIKHIRWLFPPLVTGLVILSIGLYLIPVAIKYAAGGAGPEMGKESWGSMQIGALLFQSQ